MADKDVGALIVLNSDKVVGILSERDYARKVALKGKASIKIPVSEIMTKKVLFVKPSQSIEDCMVLMTEKKIRHLPVIEKGKLLGVISIGDVVKAVIQDQHLTINQLENYIKGY